MRQGRGVVDVGDRELELLRQIRDLLDDLGERPLDVAGQRLELGGGLDDVGERLDPRDEVRLLGHVVAEPHPLGSLDQDPNGPVRDLEHPRDDPHDPHVVELVRPGLVELRVARGDQREHPLAGQDLVDEPHRTRLPDRQRGERVRVDDRLLEREHGQRRRDGLGAPLANRLLEVRRLDYFDRRPGHRDRPRSADQRWSIGTRRVAARRAERQLDPQDAVLVGGLRLLRDHVGVSSRMRRNGPASISTCW